MSALAGTPALLRLALRQDRIVLPVWAYGISALVASTAVSFDRLYPSLHDRLKFAHSVVGNVAFKALYGPPFDLTTTGGLTAWRIGSVAAVLAGLMSAQLVVRHTRAEEEAGRAELIGAAPVGRHAGLAAALLVAAIANLTLAVLVTVELLIVGLPADGAAALGLALAATGCAFGAVGAISAQLFGTRRAANAAAGAGLGLAFLLRAIGDVGNGTLSWLSPIGWAQRVRPFAGERWWVLALPLALTAVAATVAVVLAAHRDHGAGLLPARPGRPAASRWLRGPWGLAWRLQRGALAGWAAGFAAIGAASGWAASDVQSIVGTNHQLARILHRLGGTTNLVDAYLASVMKLLAVVVAGYAIQAALRIRGEETAGRAELLLAGPVGRVRWAAPHAVCGAAGTAVLMAVAGLAAGVMHGARSGHLGTEVARLLGAGLAPVPAAWTLGALAVVLVGVLPRRAALAWGALAACFALHEVGAGVGLPRGILDISPFAHVPQLPGGAVTAGPLAALVAAAAVLAAAGLAGLRRRDIPS